METVVERRQVSDSGRYATPPSLVVSVDQYPNIDHTHTDMCGVHDETAAVSDTLLPDSSGDTAISAFGGMVRLGRSPVRAHSAIRG